MSELFQALVGAGILTRAEAERLERLLDPEAAQVYAERLVASAFQRGLTLQRDRVINMLRAHGFRPTDAVYAAFWEAEARELYRDVIPVLTGVAEDAALLATVRGGGLDAWQAINESVIGWVEDYYISTEAGALGSIPNLDETARTVIGNLVNQWQRGELEAMTRAEGLPQLIAAMEQAFGPERGARIAVTEVTRVFAESTLAAAQANPNTTHFRLASARDDKVCPICGPLDGMTVPKGAAGFTHPTMGMVGFPPFHVRCRCGISEESDLTMAVPLGVGGAGTWNYPSA